MARLSAASLSLLALPWAAYGQPQGKLDPESVPPQAVIIVRKHTLGPDMVEVTIAAKNYPLELLTEQCNRVGANLGSDARGLSVVFSGFDPKFKFARASFATDGLIDRAKGEVRLQELITAFLGAPSPNQLRSFLVTLDGEAPVENQTLQHYSSDSVVLKAHVSTAPKGIEYRVLALTQDPSQIQIPSRHVVSQNVEQKDRTDTSSMPGWLPLALVGVAGAAAGLLVYSALSGRSPRPKGRPDQRT